MIYKKTLICLLTKLNVLISLSHRLNKEYYEKARMRQTKSDVILKSDAI